MVTLHAPPCDSMRICHVLSSVATGGAERVVLDLAKVQKTRGHDVTVVSLTDLEGALAPDVRAVASELACVPKASHGIDVRLPVRLAGWLRRHRVQVVHTHNELPLIYGAPAGRLAHAAVVHTKHGAVGVSRGADLLRRVAAMAVQRFVAVSAATAENALAHRESGPRKLRVVINGTDLSRFPAPPEARRAIRDELGIPGSARVLVTIGRLVPEKNHALLLRAVAPLLGAERHLLLVGDGPLRDDLRRQTAGLATGRYVHLTGARRDVPALLAAADGYVLSSDNEGLPIGLLEAWAAGLPVVSTAVGGIPDAVRAGDAGLLVPSGDEVALRAAMQRMLDGEPALQAMAERGRRHALSTYSAEGMADAYEALYAECLAR